MIHLDTSVLVDALAGTRRAARALRRVVEEGERGRAFDLAVAACAIVHEASLWTLNPEDFRDVPGLTLHRGGRSPRP